MAVEENLGAVLKGFRLRLLALVAALNFLTVAEPAPESTLDRVESVLKYPLTRSQRQVLSGLDGGQDWTPEQWQSGSDPFDQELRRIDRRARRKLVGELNQQSVDAFCEWFLFAVALSDGQSPEEAPPGPVFAAHLQQTLIQGWPKMAADNRQKLLDFPVYWASLRHDWPELAAAQKQALVSSWRSALAPVIGLEKRQELARACLADLQASYRSQASTAEQHRAVQRVETAIRRLSASGDVGQARQLQNALLAIQSQQDQKRAQQEIKNQQARLDNPDYNQVFRQINQQNVRRTHIGTDKSTE